MSEVSVKDCGCATIQAENVYIGNCDKDVIARLEAIEKRFSMGAFAPTEDSFAPLPESRPDEPEPQPPMLDEPKIQPAGDEQEPQP